MKKLKKNLSNSPRTSILGTLAGISGVVAATAPDAHVKAYAAIVTAILTALLGIHARDAKAKDQPENVPIVPLKP